MADEFPDGRQSPGPEPANPYSAFGMPSGAGTEVAPAGPTLNPWFSIWLQPRATIRQVVDTDPRRNVLLLAALAGIGEALDRASMRNMGDHVPLSMILVMACIVGPLGGILSLYIFGFLVRYTGNRLGGVANDEQVRAAIAYGSIPGIWALAIWAVQLVLFGHDMFTEEMPRLEANPLLVPIFLGIALFEIIIAIWQVVVTLKCVGEVHRFSAWRALGAMILAGLLIIVPVVLVAILVIFGIALATNW